MINVHAYEQTCQRYGIVTATIAAVIVCVRELLAMKI